MQSRTAHELRVANFMRRGRLSLVNIKPANDNKQEKKGM